MAESPRPMRRAWVALAVLGVIAAAGQSMLDKGTYPSAEEAENILRWAVDGEWKAFRLDGTPEAPRDVSSLATADCEKDGHVGSDFPLFACLYRFRSTAPLRDYIGVVGALYRPHDDGLVKVDGYVVYPWAIADQKAVLQARGVTFPVVAAAP